GGEAETEVSEEHDPPLPVPSRFDYSINSSSQNRGPDSRMARRCVVKKLLLVSALLVLFTRGAGAATCSPTTFVRAATFATGPNPQVLVSGDFNHDGQPDLAVSDSTGVSVLLNDGSGGFLPPQHTELGPTPQALVAGAFDAGNNLDLAVIRDYGTVEILLGNGDGTFTPGDSYPVNYVPANLLTADFNHDGKPDLVLTTSYGSQLTVFLGQGDGSLGPPVVTTLASQAQFPAAADFDGDTFADVAVATSSGVVAIYPGLGNGQFGSPASLKIGGGLGPIIASDLNGDRIQDIVVATDVNVALAP